MLKGVFVATDVSRRTCKKNDPIRKVKIFYFLLTTGALKSAFFNMGNIVLKDMDLISKFTTKHCKIAKLKTVGLLIQNLLQLINFFIFSYLCHQQIILLEAKE